MKPIADLSDDEFADLVQRAARLPDAPQSFVTAAQDLWSATRPSLLQTAATAALRLVNAVLSFDSWTTSPVALGVRGTTTEARHLLFSAEGRDIDLRINATADRFALTGQVLGPDEAAVIELVAIDRDPLGDQTGSQPGGQPGDGDVRRTDLDAFGEFRLEGLAEGSYRMTLHMATGDEIHLPTLELGARRR